MSHVVPSPQPWRAGVHTLTTAAKPGTIKLRCPAILKKLAEELAALDSLAKAGITTELSKVPGEERRIKFNNLPYDHTTAYFEFEEVLPITRTAATARSATFARGTRSRSFQTSKSLLGPKPSA